MNHIIRIASIVNRVVLGDPVKTAVGLVPLLDLALEQQADLILLPLHPLSGSGCGKLFTVPMMQEKITAQLSVLAKRYAEASCPIVLGKDEHTAVILYQGRIFFTAPQKISFFCGDAAVSVCPVSYHHLPLYCGELEKTGADIVLFPSYHPYKAGDAQKAQDTFRFISNTLGSALVYCNGGIGDTSAPYLYNGYCGVAENGVLTEAGQEGEKGFLSICDLDLDIIRSGKSTPPLLLEEPLFVSRPKEHQELIRPLRMDPYLPEEPDKEAAFLEEIFNLQVKSLTDRMSNTGIHKLVVGVSGGLDSTLAFLVAIKAVDRLSLPRENVIGITMPGFGTTGRTYLNAVGLIKALGASFREINISASVTQHLDDIGHSPENTDVTYENAQARERAQILLDVANDNRAFVVGTGDLSEEALGWCTFAGDHISNYNVNVCVTKTMIRKIITLLVNEERFADANEPLTDILHSPVSPELLPPDENGLIVQKTEEILGPYELHDFFLYYFVKYSMPPKKIYEYACLAFPHISSEFILEKCILFFRRLFGGQFKRSCTPDSAAITEINLSNAEFYLPSDCSSAVFLEELTDLQKK